MSLTNLISEASVSQGSECKFCEIVFFIIIHSILVAIEENSPLGLLFEIGVLSAAAIENFVREELFAVLSEIWIELKHV